jgi:hypothetical protein
MPYNTNLNDYFAVLLAIVATLNGIAIPLAYNIISENLKPYLDKHISNMFINEKAFINNAVVSIWALPILSFPLFVDITRILNTGDDNHFSIWFMNGYIILSIVFMAGFLLSFVRFSKMIYEYSSNTEEIVYEKTKSTIDEYLSK